MIWFSVASKLTRLLCRWWKYSWFQCGGSEVTFFSVGIRIDLVLCGGWRWLSFVIRGHRNWPVFRVGIAIDLIPGLGSRLTWSFCGESKLTSFSCGDRNWPSVCVRAGKHMVLEGVSTDLLFVRVVAITLVLYAGQKSPNFSVSIEIDFVWVGGRNWLEFSVGDETWLYLGVQSGEDLVLVWVVEIDLISVNGLELTRLLCGGRKWLGFSVWTDIN